LDISLHIYDILAPTGKIYIAVPDASQYINGEDAPFQEFSIEHINFFGPTFSHKSDEQERIYFGRL
jgi:predicted SAM-dependent methyltransferase